MEIVSRRPGTPASIPPDMKLSLRPATEEDFDYCREVHHAAYRPWVVAQFGKWEEEEQDRFFRESWQRWPYEIIEVDASPCGYYAVEKTVEATHIREFALHPNYQGRGIGAAFLRSFVARFHFADRPVRLRAFKANQEAISFYRHIGFTETGSTDTQLLFEWTRASVR